MVRPASNPFSTRFIRPGRIASLDVCGRPVDVGMLVDRLDRLGGTAAIVGPHGSGKSTLLTHLAEEIARRGGHTTLLRIQSSRDAQAIWAALRRGRPGTTVCLDSWECLCLAGRLLVRLLAGLWGRRLLVTAHRIDGLPVLTRCATSPAILHAVVRALPEQGLWHGSLIGPNDIEEAFAKHGGNLRESLLDLYDRFELRLREARPWNTGDDRAVCADRATSGPEIHEFGGGFSYAGAPERNLG